MFQSLMKAIYLVLTIVFVMAAMLLVGFLNFMTIAGAVQNLSLASISKAVLLLLIWPTALWLKRKIATDSDAQRDAVENLE